MPVFVGMVLGEFVVGSLWGIWGALFSTPVYQFWG
jgi:predicted PurR-regulated permease PerM